MAQVRVEGLTKTYGGARALDAGTLSFPDGGFFGLLGPSGSGKTTLLRAIAGFVVPDAGRVFIGDAPVANVPVEAREIGMVFQNYALFPNMTVAQNVAFGLEVRKVAAAERARRVAEALELVQLGPFGARKTNELSGGQRQRVAMARAIVRGSPFSAATGSRRRRQFRFAGYNAAAWPAPRARHGLPFPCRRSSRARSGPRSHAPVK